MPGQRRETVDLPNATGYVYIRRAGDYSHSWKQYGRIPGVVAEWSEEYRVLLLRSAPAGVPGPWAEIEISPRPGRRTS
jgi:hypothetical protein